MGYDACAEPLWEVKDIQRGATPNVGFGLSFVSAEVATDPALLGSDSALGDRESVSSPLGPRAAVPAAKEFTRGPSQPGAFPVSAAGPTHGPGPRPSAPALRPLPAGPAGIASVAPEVPVDAPTITACAAAFALAVLFAALYARIRRREALLAGPRAEMVAHLQARGPTMLVQLARQMGLDRTTVKYHARALARASIVALRHIDRRMVIALPGQELPTAIPAPRGASREIMFALLRAHGGSLPREAIHKLAADMPVRTRNKALRELCEQGAVVSVTDASGTVIRLTSATAA